MVQQIETEQTASGVADLTEELSLTSSVSLGDSGRALECNQRHHAPAGKLPHRGRYALDHACHIGAPASHDHQVLFWITDDGISSCPGGGEGRFAHSAAIALMAGVQPPHEAVAGIEGAGLGHLSTPALGDDPSAAPLATISKEQAETSVVQRVNPQPTPPVGPA